MGTAGPQRPDRMPEDMPDGMSDRMPEDMSDRMPEDIPDRMPEDMSDRMPEDMPDRMPEDLPDRMPEDMPDRMPEDMPGRMPEDMSDRMPEDLPVRNCINVMVGITRSKVIFTDPSCDFFFCFVNGWQMGSTDFDPRNRSSVKKADGSCCTPAKQSVLMCAVARVSASTSQRLTPAKQRTRYVS